MQMTIKTNAFAKIVKCTGLQSINDKKQLLKTNAMSNFKKFHVPYGMTPNNLLNHKGISLKAKGLFAFMQSKPDGWKFSGKLIATQCKESLDSILSGLKELEDFGYLERQKKITPSGFVTTYFLHESVDNHNLTEIENPRGENPALEKPRRENPTLENPTLENPTLENPVSISNKEVSKKELSNKKIELGQKEKFLPPTLNDVISFFQKENLKANPANFFHHWESVGWKKTRGQQIYKWESLVPKWVENEIQFTQGHNPAPAPAKKIPAERKQLLESFKTKTRGFIEKLQTDASALETARIKFNHECNQPFEFNSQAVYIEINAYQLALLNEPHLLADDYLKNITFNDFKRNFFVWFKKQKHYSSQFSETPNKAHRPMELQQ
jgi:hypothetical protein